MAAESRTVTESMLSDYSLESHRVLHGKEKYSQKKLITSFLPKKKYVCHYMCLKEYLLAGLILTKVHKVLTFRQSRYIEKFMNICTGLRKNAKTVFKKQLYKRKSQVFIFHICNV